MVSFNLKIGFLRILAEHSLLGLPSLRLCKHARPLLAEALIRTADAERAVNPIGMGGSNR